MSYRHVVTSLSLFLLFLGLPALGFGQNTFSVPFSYQIGGSVPGSVTYNITTPTSVTIALVTDSATWVSASLSSTTTTPTAPAVLTISVKPTGLQAGTYNSTIQVTSSIGSVVFNVTLIVTAAATNLTLSSSSFTFTAVAGGVTPPSQTLTVTAQSSTSVTAQASEQTCTTSNWLTLSPTGNFTAGTSGTNFTVSVNQSGLTAGTTCTGTVSMMTSAGTQSATVTLNVTAPNASGLTLSSSALTFNAVAGGIAPGSQALTVTAQASTAATAQVSEQSCTTTTWLTLSPTGNFTAGPSNTSFTVSVNQSGLSAGTQCTGTISMNTASGTQSATVTMNVISATVSGLIFSSSTFTFNAAVGGAAPPSQTLTVTAQTNTGATAQISEQSCATSTWLTLSPTGSFTAGPTNANFTVSVNQSGIAGGTTCTGTISMATAAGTQTATVTLNVSGLTITGLTVSTNALTFSAVPGAAPPPSLSFDVLAPSYVNATVQVKEQTCASVNWLTVSPSGTFLVGPATTTVTVSVNQAGFSVGNLCTGAITIAASSGTQTVNVTLSLIASASSVLTVSPSSLTFNAVAGAAAPASQMLAVTAFFDTSAAAQVSEQTCTTANWLALTPTGSFTASPSNSTFTVSVDPSSFTATASCAGTISMVTSSGTQTVTVTLSLAPAVSLAPAITVLPTGLSFTYSVGDPSPPPQVVAISASGAAALFSVSTTSSGWLQVAPSCIITSPCITPNAGTLNLAVTVDPTGLPPGGPYFGTIVITGIGQAAGTTNVNVSFTVTAPTPFVALVTNAASFITGPVSPGEMISIFGNPSAPIGPPVGVSLSAVTCPNPCTSVPTTLGGVQVIFQPGGVAAPITFANSTQINCLVPYEILGGTSVQMQVKYLGQNSNAVGLQYTASQPGIFTATGTGTGLASVQQYDAQGTYQGQNSSSNPAKAGWYLTFYVTGEGIIPSPAVTGKVTTTASIVPLLGPPTVLIDNLPSTVTYFAEANGFVSGIMQVNAIVPAGVHTGQQVPLTLSMNGSNSQSGVVIYIN